MKLYGLPQGNSFRNHWFLHEIGVEYETIQLNMKEREHRSPEFLKLNPAGQVPVLVDEDFVVAESLAINYYLGEKYQSDLLGTALQEKALVWQWSIWGTLNLQQHFGEIYLQKYLQKIIAKTPDEKIIENAKENLEKHLPVLEAALEGKEYLVGNKFTVAEINIITSLTYAGVIGFDLSKYKNITRWFQTHMNRPACKKARGV